MIRIESIKVEAMEYQEYGKRDFKQMEGLNNGEWCFIGIQAEATVSYPENGNNYRWLETLTVGGVWGIESDSKDYLNEIMAEQLTDLRYHLEKFNVDCSNFDELTPSEIEWR